MKVKLAAFLLVSTISCGDIQLPKSEEERDLIHANTPSATDTANTFIVDAFLTPDQIINQKGLDCLSGIRRAQADRAKGIIGYYFWGESIPFYADTLEKRYGMTIHRSGCSVDLEEEASWICYNHFMDSVILTKYHVNLIEQEDQKSRQRIRNLLSKQKRDAIQDRQ